jgi:peptidoglycan/xylan/chitin deacetylase (PgdA/CDA1 family)
VSRIGALVISLDFELHWGVRDVHGVDSPYRQNLLGVRKAIPAMLELFAEYGVAATWATVGFLFARGPQDLERFRPSMLPRYENGLLSPYSESVGPSENDDPLHFAPSLIEQIRAAPRQELGSHTYSHYYTLADGQDHSAFAADLESAVAIASRSGLHPRSLVFPRNQVNTEYLDVVEQAGFVCFRGIQHGWLYKPRRFERGRRLSGACRLLDAHLPTTGGSLTDWQDVRVFGSLVELPASCFLRPYSPTLRMLESLRVAKIVRGLRAASRRKAIFHLWWHPHNFGTHLDENLAVLQRILEEFKGLESREGLRSMTMSEAAAHAQTHAA